jgi:acyl carrier protein
MECQVKLRRFLVKNNNLEEIYMIKVIYQIINEMLEESGQERIIGFESTMSLREDLGLDSLMLAELTVKIENEFGVDIFEDGIVQTLGEVILKIERKTNV